MKNLLFTLALLISFNSFSQNLAYGNEIEGIEICKQLGINTQPILLDKEVNETLEQILSIVGLEKNFQLQMCSNINNAAALTYNGVRYIFYDLDFLNSISGENRWFVTFVLAHEIGHHLNDHTKDVFMYVNGFPNDVTLDKRRNQELQADKFAGFIMGKLGSSYSDAVNAISQIPGDEIEDLNSDHPSEDLRVKALVEGYSQATGTISGMNFSKFEGSNTGEYLISYYNGVEKFNNGDLDGALKDFNKSIIDKKEFPEPYINRSLIKELKGDLYGAISDLELAMKWNPNLDILYVERGVLKIQLGKYESALDDFNIAISKNQNSLEGYFNRAVLRYNNLLGIYQSNISSDFNQVILDFSKCIDIYPNYLEARNYRAQAIISGLRTKQTDHLVDTAINDINISLEYVDDYEFTTETSLKFFKLQNHANRAIINSYLGNFSSVYSDTNIIIDYSKDSLNTEIYLEKFVLGNLLKFNLLSDKNSLYYDVSEICKNLNDFTSIINPIMDNINLNNPLIFNGINQLVNASIYEYDCL